ncbi:reverse transcriptase [Elysia marginata]|uniref:Reverse transcriptase n=1 Tax=Elysia marginata TaxID=1093978 RepID=A0AAV4G415_9GAST|nr:reverse transcriptase [Elysia marginata]
MASCPAIKFNNKPQNLQEEVAVVKLARAKSGPGPNGVPYFLYKRCPNVLKWLHKILRSAWNKLKTSKQWMTAEGVYIRKEQNSEKINQFRPFQLLNVENKKFIPVMATRQTKYLTKWIHKHLCSKGWYSWSFRLLRTRNNNIIMIWEAVQRAKSEKLSLDVVWLDLVNAYGSVSHEKIQLAPRMYHIPEDIQVMPDDSFSGFHMKFSNSDHTTNWINLEVGIAAGCTILPMLFVMEGKLY